jgi:hypothetical protein
MRISELIQKLQQLQTTGDREVRIDNSPVEFVHDPQKPLRDANNFIRQEIQNGRNVNIAQVAANYQVDPHILEQVVLEGTLPPSPIYLI